MLKELEPFKLKYANIINHYKQKAHFSSNIHKQQDISNLSSFTQSQSPDGKTYQNDNNETNTSDLNQYPPKVNQNHSASSLYKISIYDSIVNIDEYWIMQPVSRWWWSQSRENVYDYFNHEFWNLLDFLEKCMTTLDKPTVAKKTLHDCSNIVNFMDELLPSLVFLKTIYPTYTQLTDLLQDIVDILYIYYNSMEQQLNHLSKQVLVEEMIF